MSNIYDVSYVHKTTNHLVFDRIRQIQLDVDFLCSYLQREEASRVSGAGLSSEIKALMRVHNLLFEDVYQSLRSKWC